MPASADTLTQTGLQREPMLRQEKTARGPAGRSQRPCCGYCGMAPMHLGARLPFPVLNYVWLLDRALPGFKPGGRRTRRD